MRLGHDIKKTARSCDKEVTPFLKLSNLLTNWTTAICNAGSQHGAIAESPSLVEDLATELTSRSDDEDEGLATDAVTLSIKSIGQIGTRCSKLLRLAHELGDDWNEECCSLARP